MDKFPVLHKFPVSLKILTFLVIILTSVIIVSLLGIEIAIPFFGHDVTKKLELIGSSTDSEIIAIAKYFQIVNQIALFFIPVILFAFLDGRNIGKYLNINSRPAFKTMIFAAAAILASTPLINFLAELNQKMILPSFMSGVEQWMKDSENNAGKITDAFLHVTTTGGFIINILMIGIIPAIGEEFLFRGVLQKLFHQWSKNIHFAVIFSAFLFSAIHLQFYGFIPRFLMGVFLGYTLVWSGSLWVPILIHFVNNSADVIVSYFVNKGTISNTMETIGTGEKAIIPVLISLFLTTGFIYFIYHFEKKKKTTSMELSK
jgi:hypothetical protein